MSDSDLSTALADLAAEVDLVDFGSRVDRAIAQRRGRRAVMTVAGTVIAVFVVVAGVIAIADRGGRSARPAHHLTPRPSPSMRTLSLAQRLPRYIPPAAHLIHEGPKPTHYPTAAVYQAVWRANRAHIRFSIIDDRKLRPCPTVGAPQHLDRIKTPCGPDTGWLYDFAPLADGYPQTINGRTGHVTEEHPAGIQDVEWREGSFHYLLVGNRTTPGGGALTGVPFRQIVRMARSVRSDPSIPATPALPNPPGVSIPTSALDGFTYWQRELLDANGAVVSYLRGEAHFDLYIEPAAAKLDDQSRLGGLSDIHPELHPHNVTITHARVDGTPAVVWAGPQDIRGMRLHLDGYTIGFYGRYGATIADFKRIATAMHVIPHQP